MITLKKQKISTTDHIQLAAYTAGDVAKPSIVLVHGFPDTHHIWQPLLEQLLNDFHIVCYDVRGAGASDKPQKQSAYKLAQLADDLWQVTQQVLGDKSFHVVAHDWGSIQTWESVCQARFKGRMLSFTSISGPSLAHFSSLMKKPFDKPFAKANQMMSSWYVYVFQVPFVSNLLWKTVAQNWHKLHNLPKSATQLEDGLFGMKLYRANIFQTYIKSNKQRKAICPVHVLLFTKDSYVKPITYHNISDMVDDLTVSQLPLRHWDIYNKATQVAVSIKDYLQSLQSTH